MARPVGFEPTACGFEVRRSIQAELRAHVIFSSVFGKVHNFLFEGSLKIELDTSKRCTISFWKLYKHPSGPSF